MKLFLLSFRFGRIWEDKPTCYELVYAANIEEAKHKLDVKFAGGICDIENCTIE